MNRSKVSKCCNAPMRWESIDKMWLICNKCDKETKPLGDAKDE